MYSFSRTGGVVTRTTSRCCIDATETTATEIKLLDEDLYDPNRIILGGEILEALG